MSQDDEIEFENPIEDEIEETYDNPQVFSKPADTEITSFLDKIKRGLLVLQPDFQRYYVWDDIKASRLIESSLLEIPLPTIYLSEESDNKTYVIDGQQRLTSFVSFINGTFPDGSVFKLRGLKAYTDLNKKGFNELPIEYQDKILHFTIRTITFLKQSGRDLKFEIFERLNTGSVALNDQELRNCVYRGKYNKLLKEMSEFTDFKYLTGLTEPDRRMADIELVLRFCAFYHATYLKYKPPMKKFLNNDMLKYQNISDEDAQELKDKFKNGLMIVRSMFDKNAFKRYYRGKEDSINGYWEPKKFNFSLYDVLLGILCTQDRNVIYQKMDSIREGFIDLMVNDESFINSIELSTSSIQAVVNRFDKFRIMVQDITGINSHETRIFSMTLKKELFHKNPTCAICNQQILSIDDSAVDHIEQYWNGGRTIPENARLTHRYCNWSRPRKE